MNRDNDSMVAGLVVLGISHKSTGVAFREQMAFSPRAIPEALSAVSSAVGLDQVIILSTCNRVEFLALCSREDEYLFDRLLDWLGNYHRIELSELESRYYGYRGERALRHLIEVGSGLNSMVLGEPQIFGQMKSAVAVAQQEGFVGADLKRIVDGVFSVVKQVRTCTGIGRSPVSIACVAANLATTFFDKIAARRVLLLGAGDTIKLVAKYLHEAMPLQLTIANRTLSQARQLAENFGAETILFSQVPEYLKKADIVISATASQLPIIGKGAIEQALQAKQGKTMLLIDLAVPRDIEAQVNKLEGVKLYTIDDLAGTIEKSKLNRQAEVTKANDIIDQGIENFHQQLQSRDVASTVKAYRDKAVGIRDAELARAVSLLQAGHPPEDVVEKLARNLTNKLIHSPSIKLRQLAAFSKDDMIVLAKELFELADQPD